MKPYVKIVMFVTIFVILVINTFLHSVVVFAWGDSTYLETGVVGSTRQFYTLDQVNNGALGDKITFNSITDAEIGDERSFTSAQKAAPDGLAIDSHGIWEGNELNVEDGKEYIVRLYVHNDSTNGTTGVSTGTKVAISGVNEDGTWQSKSTSDGKQQVELNGFILSENSTPKEYWDYIRFNSNSSFHLDYVMDSAVIYNRGAVGTTDPVTAAQAENMSVEELNAHEVTGRPLSDDIVMKAGSENGTLIGFDALDGNLPGCYAYSTYVTIRVKAVYDNNFTIKATARLAGEKKWSEYIDAKVGDKVELQIEYTNTSSERQDGVSIREYLASQFTLY